MAAAAVPLFGRYTDAELIGAGRIGAVYRATDSLLGRLVALKVLDDRLAGDAVARRFVRETLAAARLSSNPHIVAVFDVGELDGQAYIVMEYLPGGSLAERVRQEGAQRPQQVLDWLDQAAAALDAAHAEGLVHGDVRPHNLLLDARGEIRLVDFGIAETVLLGSRTEPGSPAGDRYALALTAYELLSGRLPFAGDGAAQADETIPSLSAVDPSLPGELDVVFAAALAQEPAQRYGTCAEFAPALRAAFADAAAPTLVRPPEPRAAAAAAPPPVTHAAPRRRVSWPLVVVAVLAVLAAGLAAALLSSRHGPARAHGESASARTATRAPARRTRRTPTAPVAAGAASAAHALNDQGFALMQRGAYQAALPLLEQAVRGLQGRADDPYDGYANYNLGVVLTKLGRCSDALPYLRAAEQIEPERPEVGAAIEVARRCAAGGH